MAGNGGRIEPATCGVTAWVQRHSILPIINEVKARAIAAAGIKITIGAEFRCANRVAGISLTPVLDQELLRTSHGDATCVQPRQPARPSSSPPATARKRVGLRNTGVSRFVGDRPGEFPPRTQGEVLVTVQLVRMVVTTWLANRSDRGATASSVFDREARTSSGFRREAHI